MYLKLLNPPDFARKIITEFCSWTRPNLYKAALAPGGGDGGELQRPRAASVTAAAVVRRVAVRPAVAVFALEVKASPRCISSISS